MTECSQLSTAPRALLAVFTQLALLVLDLAAVAFMSSHGVSLLLDAHQEDDHIHGRLHLTGVSSNRSVSRVLDLTGLMPLFDIHDDQDQLIRELAR